MQQFPVSLFCFCFPKGQHIHTVGQHIHTVVDLKCVQHVCYTYSTNQILNDLWRCRCQCSRQGGSTQKSCLTCERKPKVKGLLFTYDLT